MNTIHRLERGRTLLALRRAATDVVYYFEQRLDPLGLTPGGFELLRAIAIERSGSLTAIARLIGLTLQGTRRLVDGYVMDGFLQLTTSSEDRRCLELTLLPRGEAALENGLLIAAEIERAFQSDIDSIPFAEWVIERAADARRFYRPATARERWLELPHITSDEDIFGPRSGLLNSIDDSGEPPSPPGPPRRVEPPSRTGFIDFPPLADDCVPDETPWFTRARLKGLVARGTARRRPRFRPSFFSAASTNDPPHE